MKCMIEITQLLLHSNMKWIKKQKSEYNIKENYLKNNMIKTRYYKIIRMQEWKIFCCMIKTRMMWRKKEVEITENYIVLIIQDFKLEVCEKYYWLFLCSLFCIICNFLCSCFFFITLKFVSLFLLFNSHYLFLC